MSTQVLVVDDSPIIRELLRLSLEGAGFEVTEAEDGEAAVDTLKRRTPHLIVCDLSMPRLDGMGLLDVLRHDPKYARVPVLMLTVESQPEASAAAKAHGAQAFMRKPCRASDLLATVARLCERHGIPMPKPRPIPA